ncbi:hypothetical protein HDU83_004912 [Entophlyctis luteolus]|nr:hypothetical protein HDU83_004912 [Entophlyctis luteolus]
MEHAPPAPPATLPTSSRTGRSRQVYTAPNVRKVVGVVPVLPDGRIVLVSSSSSASVLHPAAAAAAAVASSAKWILPKGGAETDETLVESALREAFEEAGLVGAIRTFLCSFRSEKESKHGGVRSTDFDFFVMDVASMESQWPESESRARELFTPEQALDALLSHKSNSLHLALEAYITSHKIAARPHE